MSSAELRDKLRGEIAAVDAASLLPHHRRGALLLATPDLDILDAAMAIAADDSARVSELLASGRLGKPSLAQIADWCVDSEQQFQFVILQPYVLAQILPKG